MRDAKVMLAAAAVIAVAASGCSSLSRDAYYSSRSASQEAADAPYTPVATAQQPYSGSSVAAGALTFGAGPYQGAYTGPSGGVAEPSTTASDIYDPQVFIDRAQGGN